MKFDIAFIHRIYRETVWFSAVIALVLYMRGQPWPVWAGVFAGAAVAVGAFFAIEQLVVFATKPDEGGRLKWLQLMNLFLLPIIGIILYLYVSVIGLNIPAIAVGVTVPLVVGAMKALGRAWGNWAADGRTSAGPPSEPEE